MSTSDKLLTVDQVFEFWKGKFEGTCIDVQLVGPPSMDYHSLITITLITKIYDIESDEWKVFHFTHALIECEAKESRLILIYYRVMEEYITKMSEMMGWRSHITGLLNIMSRDPVKQDVIVKSIADAVAKLNTDEMYELMKNIGEWKLHEG